MKTTIITIIAAFAILFTTTGCKKEFICVKPSGDIITQNIPLEDFTGFSLCIEADVHVSQGPQSFEVTGPSDLVENLKLKVKNDILEIDYDRCVWNSKDMDINISLPQLTYAAISGSGDIDGTSVFENLENLELKISGSGNIDLEVYANEVNSKISGSGDITLAGTANRFDTKISGSGDINAYNMPVQDCYTQISGSGNNWITVQNTLNVDISGSGDVHYKGNPALTVSISGSGNVIHEN